MAFLEVGDVFEIKKGDTVKANVPKHFTEMGEKGNFALAKSTITIEGELLFLVGEYVVRKTAVDGGTSPGARDAYPNGHHVHAVSLDNKHAISFYQSGCFNYMITRNIKVLGKAELKYVYKGKVSK